MDIKNIFNLIGLMGIDMDDEDRQKFEKIMAISRADTSDVAKLRCVSAILLDIPESDIPEFNSIESVKSYLTQMVHPNQKAQVRGIFGFIEESLKSSEVLESTNTSNLKTTLTRKLGLNSGDDESNGDAQDW